jgi:hypothetical protein
MSFHVKVTNKKIWTFLSIFMASALIFAPLVLSTGVFAQPFSIIKISKETKSEKCNLGTLPAAACKNLANRGQGNNGGISNGQAASGGSATSGGANGTGEAGASGGLNNAANPAISQNQQSTQSCASGNIKLLPHSSLTCSNTANLGQTNNGSISTGQTAGGG